jgi:GTP-binding protein Era
MAPLRSGFVGLIGRPNVGKSTMLNYYLGEKVAIVSPHPQTTRRRILGVLTRPQAQVIFVDTPGLHQPRHALGRYMVEVAKAVLEEVDVVVVLIDGRVGITAEDEQVFGRLRHLKRPALLAINKVDVVKKPRLLPVLAAAAATGLFDECIPVSALSGVQMGVLLERVMARLPEGPHWYEPQQRTDQTTTQRISEFIREQVMLATYQEVPHAVGVQVEQIEEKEKTTVIHATILVERPGQKAILIGQAGQMLKRIGREARLQIERLLGRDVYLELWVKVAEDWRGNTRILRELGYSESG